MPTARLKVQDATKVGPQYRSISENVDSMQEALNRALVIAKSDSADPNERCAAITVALAIVACPTRVKIRGWLDGSLEVRFESLKVTLPRSGRFIWTIIFAETNKSGTKHYFQFVDLAESYADHNRNMECLKLLNRHFDTELERTAKAAVLGLAWAQLQRRNISTCFSVGGDESGLHLECEDLGIGIRVVSGIIVDARYPGLQTALKSESS